MEETSGLDDLEKAIGYQFRDRSLLERSLTHPSFGGSGRSENPQFQHNQRLEFFGDAVLGLILAEELFRSMPARREGDLTRNRAILVNGVQLAAMARQLGLPRYIRMSESEIQNRGRDRDSILEDALEALIAAIYLDSDLPTVRATVLGWYGNLAELVQGALSRYNPKGRLQEILQPVLGNDCLQYSVVETKGPDHDRRFAVEVSVEGQVRGRGVGSSKKEAEEMAAQEALNHVGQMDLSNTDSPE